MSRAQPAYRVVKGLGRFAIKRLIVGVWRWEMGQSLISPSSQFAGRRDQERGE